MRSKVYLTALTLSVALPLWAAVPLSEPPQTLMDEEGNPEIGLVDPFTPRAEGAALSEEGEPGVVRTSLGDLPADFRILAILIPDREGAKPSALIRMNEEEAPTLVQEGDQIRIQKEEKGVRKLLRKDQKEDERYVFYLYVKTIAPTYLEVYHSKKRPDETLILSW